LEGCRRFALDTELAGSSKEEVSLEEGDRVGYGPKKEPKLCRSSCSSIVVVVVVVVVVDKTRHS
jgi:hypothetical protein